MRVRTLLADDHRPFMEGLSRLLVLTFEAKGMGY